jgi:type VI protein secretion system component Hcp
MIKFEGGKIDIPGEAQLEGYNDGKWIEGTSFSEGAYIPRDASGSGQAAGRATVQEFVITTVAGVHSNQLRTAILENNVYPTMYVHFLKQIGNKTEAYDIRTYKNVFVSNYAGSKGSDGAMMESWSLGATSVEWEYKKQKPDTHDLVTANSAQFDFAKSASG